MFQKLLFYLKMQIIFWKSKKILFQIYLLLKLNLLLNQLVQVEEEELEFYQIKMNLNNYVKLVKLNMGKII